MNLEKSINILKKLRVKKSVFWDTTDGWQNIFSKRSSKTEDLLNFLSPRANSATGIGIQHQSNIESQNSFELLAKITLRSCPNIISFLDKVKSENLFGEECFKYKDSFYMSRSTLMNANSCYLILDQMEKRKKLNKLQGEFHKEILEIGSGFGELARQLIKFGGAKNCHFHLVDLPQNLFFAELYLGQIFGSNSISKSIFNVVEKFQNNTSGCKFSFYLPSELEDYFIQNIDFAINTYSLQEMLPATVKAYVNYIEKNLKSDGLFFSINAPKKWNIKKYSDYNFHTLKCLNSINYRFLNPAGLGATTPIFNVFTIRNSKDKVLDIDDISNMDKIGTLQDLGMGIFLEKISGDMLSITDPNKIIRRYLNLKKEDLKNNIDLLFQIALDNEEFFSNIKLLKEFARSPFFHYFSDVLIFRLDMNLRLSGEIKMYYKFLSHYYGLQKRPHKFIVHLIRKILVKFRAINIFSFN